MITDSSPNLPESSTFPAPENGAAIQTPRATSLNMEGAPIVSRDDNSKASGRPETCREESVYVRQAAEHLEAPASVVSDRNNPVVGSASVNNPSSSAILRPSPPPKNAILRPSKTPPGRPPAATADGPDHSGRGPTPGVPFRNLLSSPEFRSRLTPDQLTSLTELLRVLSGEVVSTRQENAALKQSLTNALEHVMKLGQQNWRGGAAVGGAGEIAGRPLGVLRENERFRDAGMVDGRGHSSGRDGPGPGSSPRPQQDGGPVAANSYPDDPAAEARLPWEETGGVYPGTAGPMGSFFEEEESEPGEFLRDTADSGSLRETPASLPSDYGDFAADPLPPTLAPSDAPLGSGVVSNGRGGESSSRVGLSDSGDVLKLGPVQPFPRKILVAHHVPMSFARPSVAPRAPAAVECCCDLSGLIATSHWEQIHTSSDFATGVDESGGSMFRERMMQVLFSTMVGALKRGIVRSKGTITHDLSDLSTPQMVFSLRSELFWPMVAGFMDRYFLDSTLLQYVRVLYGVTRFRAGYGWGPGGSSTTGVAGTTSGQCRCRNCSQCLFQRKAALLWDSPGVDGRPLGILTEGPMSSDAFMLMAVYFGGEFPIPYDEEVAEEASVGRGAGVTGGVPPPPDQSGSTSRAAVGPVRRADPTKNSKGGIGAVVPENTELEFVARNSSKAASSARRRDSTGEQYAYSETAFFRSKTWYPMWNQPLQQDGAKSESYKQFFPAEETFVDRKLQLSQSLGEPMVFMRQWFKRIDQEGKGGGAGGAATTARKDGVPSGLAISKRSAILLRAGVICAFLAVLLLHGFGKDPSPNCDVHLSGES